MIIKSVNSYQSCNVEVYLIFCRVNSFFEKNLTFPQGKYLLLFFNVQYEMKECVNICWQKFQFLTFHSSNLSEKSVKSANLCNNKWQHANVFSKFTILHLAKVFLMNASKLACVKMIAKNGAMWKKTILNRSLKY